MFFLSMTHHSFFIREQFEVGSSYVKHDWNDDSQWVKEDKKLIQIVEQRREKDKGMNYDEMFFQFLEDDWTEICVELKSQTKTKNIRNWLDVKRRFKKIIVKKVDAEQRITEDDMKSLRQREMDKVPRILEKVCGKSVHKLTKEDIPPLATLTNDVKEKEWNTLTNDVKDKVNHVRDLVCSYSFHLKCQYPPGSLIRNFFTCGVVRKELLFHFALVEYEREGNNVTPELMQILKKNKNILKCISACQ